MKGGVTANGYTIVELLIFLAVSSVLAVAVITSFNGRQGRSTFTDGMRNIQSKLDDTVNDVETGYTSQDSFGCEYSGSSITFSAGGTGIGTNSTCAFMGKIAVLTDREKIDFYSVFGRSFITDIEDLPQDYSEAALAAVATPESFGLPNGIELIRTTGGGVGGDPDAVGVYVDLSQYAGDGTGGTGEHSASQSSILFAADSYSDAGSLTKANSEVVLCFQSGTSNQFATLTIGGTGGLPGLVTTLQIMESTCA